MEVGALVWLTMLGAAAGFRQGAHLSVTFLVARFAPRGRRASPEKSASNRGFKVGIRPRVRGSIPRSMAGEVVASVKSSSAVLGRPSGPLRLA